jgi:diguanylate cyclase (GGDEF)-like protein/PAS domain S-box-containing protein
VEIPLAVLLVEDSEVDAQLIVRLLKKAGYAVGFERVENAEQMRSALTKRAWDIVISDYNLPQFNGSVALELLKEGQPHIPFIVVSGAIGEEIAVGMMKAGAHDYLMKDNLARLAPAVKRELEQAVIRRERKQAEQDLRESEERYRMLVERASDAIFVLNPEGKCLEVNSAGCKLLGYTREEILQLAVQDVAKVSAGNPLRFKELREGKTVLNEREMFCKDGTLIWAEISARQLPDGNLQGIVRDITSRKEAEEKIQRLNSGLEQLAMTDYLTSLYNRRYFMQRGSEEFKRAWRNNQSLALLMLDIDHFKKVNDTYGHAAGDMVLQQVAAALKSSLRETDILGRMGGEEFAILLPNTLLREAGLLAERIQRLVVNLPFEVPGAVLNITISIGVVVVTGEMSGIDYMLRNADAAMYNAKLQGGNRVELYKDASYAPKD